MSGVKYPKITTVGFVLKRPFVDVSSLCRSSFFLFFNIFCVWNFFVFTLRETCFTFIFRVEKSAWWAGLKALHFKALYLEFLTAHRTGYLTLLSHICCGTRGFKLRDPICLRPDQPINSLVSQSTLWSVNQLSLSVGWGVLAIQRPSRTTRWHGALEFQTK